VNALINRALRARETVAILSERDAKSTPVKASEVWLALLERIPLAEDELVKNAGGLPRGEANWRWTSDDLAKAKWISKDPSGNGLWTLTREGERALEEFPDATTFAARAHGLYQEWAKTRDNARDEELRSVILPSRPDQTKVIEAARLFVDRGFKDELSVFAQGRSVWNEAAADELVERFVNAAPVDAQGFVDRLAVQLKSASDDAVLLMAELVAFQLLPIAHAIGERAKNERVNAVLALMGLPVEVPVEVRSAFAGGSFNPGPGMMSNVAGGLMILVRAVRDWLALDEERKVRLLADPLDWRTFVLGVKGDGFPSQRNALMYMVHPQFFGAIVSEDNKRAIRDAFLGEIERSTGDLDQDLFNITTALQVKEKKPIHFYDEPWRARWQAASLVDQEEVNPNSESASLAARSLGELSATLNMPEAWLSEVIDLVESKKQMVLYGPPGTGKTYLARELGRYISGGKDTTTIVQFHPSYSYEDFFEGYRPVTNDSGILSFTLKPGPFRLIADAARLNPEFKYVLVIDEINRGNLSKIFGELYFLLEYRDEELQLLYGKQEVEGVAEHFTLPPNVYIIGTMNTADRSIALLDSAMRRRFAFVELHPERQPVRDMFTSWLKGRAMETELGALLEKLNSRISEDQFKIGPSYLMKEDMTEERLALVWKHEILPLLEELHFGEGVNVSERYGLESLRKSALAAGDEKGA
jgi:5-methylcytosine-specific restriction enzyme B